MIVRSLLLSEVRNVAFVNVVFVRVVFAGANVRDGRGLAHAGGGICRPGQ